MTPRNPGREVQSSGPLQLISSHYGVHHTTPHPGQARTQLLEGGAIPNPAVGGTQSAGVAARTWALVRWWIKSAVLCWAGRDWICTVTSDRVIHIAKSGLVCLRLALLVSTMRLSQFGSWLGLLAPEPKERCLMVAAGSE